MPSISEIIAAKKAAATVAGVAAKPVTTAAPVRGAPLSERIEAEAAMNRIDPPGKQERASSARKAAGLILNNAPMPAATTTETPRLLVPQGVTQPSNDQAMCVWIEDRTLWLCMPCEDATMPPIKVLRLPWTVWPLPPADPLPEGDPF